MYCVSKVTLNNYAKIYEMAQGIGRFNFTAYTNYTTEQGLQIVA